MMKMYSARKVKIRKLFCKTIRIMPFLFLAVMTGVFGEVQYAHADAYHYYEDSQGIIYELNTTEKEGTVCNYSENICSDITIPAKIFEDGISYDITWIYDESFAECTDLQNVIISEGIRDIGEDAFYECNNLKKVTVPMSIRYFENQHNRLFTVEGYMNTVAQTYASKNNLTFVSRGNPHGYFGVSNALYWVLDGEGQLTISGTGSMGENTEEGNYWETPYDKDFVKSIKIKEGVSNIASHAFSGCYFLTKAELADSVTVIGDSAFYACEDMESINIPKKVTAIGEYAFCGCGNLTDVVLPDTLEEMGCGIFENCTGLENMVIPSGVAELKDWSFEDCESLATIELNGNLKILGMNVFSGCQGLTKIQLPKSLQEMGYGVFANSGITDITVETGNTCFCVEDGVLYPADKSAILWVSGNKTGNYKMPSTVKSIDAQCMRGNSLSRIDISEGIAELVYNEFADCTNLSTVTIPASVTKIGYNAFINCKNMKSVTIPSSVKEIEEQAFGYCFPDDEDDCGDGNLKVGGFCIYGYTGSAAEQYAKVNGFAFSPLNSESTTQVPAASGATPGAAGITPPGDHGNSTNETGKSTGKKTEPTEVTVSKAVYKITSKKKRTVSYKGSKKKKISSVTIPAKIKIKGTSYKVTAIADNAFKGNKNLKKVTIGKNITSIGKNAFKGCSRLKSININSSKITKVGKNAFKGIPKRPKVKTPKGKKVQYQKLFEGNK
ncbi:MAG: leucine-rich repeat domain-containing protein [Clostridium sp.]|nr:leucine-rich repeat domain-containing protein [Clostridium sp.]